ncbi:protein of unknown function DUF485 [Ammonifex degensii KC4]|uniref:DUF485 domain-containing protein n=1 Tax=Ammonifex degensii (strain DSM 10501 / KC4) TaxID=429009 RepID=C9R9F6_AMMDK|nr:DUF485 domain-containing protein [Ammonifex degensii]ACX52935.1 protein of unknown function DUF485 [Ammonifex degensii KC4]
MKRGKEEVVNSAPFRRLLFLRWTVATVLLLVVMVVYYAFVVLAGGPRQILSPLVDKLPSLWFWLGVLVIIIGLAATAIYVVWANLVYDPLAEKLAKEVEE